MALLNPPNIIPEATRVVVESTRSRVVGYSHQRLVESLTPGPLGGADAKNAADTVRAARTLGLLQPADDGETLGPTTRALLDTPDGKALERGRWRDVLRSAVLADAPAKIPFAKGNVEDEAWTSGARDFLRAVTWFLAQDALGPALSSEDAERLQQEQIGLDRELWPVVNYERFPPLLRWAVATGLASRWPDGIRPVPIEAVKATVAQMPAGRVTVDVFLTRLAEALPMLWPGEYRMALVEFCGADPDPDVAAGGMDSSIAIALMSLEAKQVLNIDLGADAATRLIMLPTTDTPRSVSHVEVR